MAAMTCGRLCLPASAATTCAAAPRVPRAAQQQGLGACEAARCALPGAPVERARSARTAQTATSIFVDTCRQTSSQELFFFINSCARGQGIACVKRRTRLVVVHARAGGSVWPLEDGRHVALHAREAVVADLRRAAAAAPHCVRAAREARRGRLHADRRGIERCSRRGPRDVVRASLDSARPQANMAPDSRARAVASGMQSAAVRAPPGSAGPLAGPGRRRAPATHAPHMHRILSAGALRVGQPRIGRGRAAAPPAPPAPPLVRCACWKMHFSRWYVTCARSRGLSALRLPARAPSAAGARHAPSSQPPATAPRQAGGRCRAWAPNTASLPQGPCPRRHAQTGARWHAGAGPPAWAAGTEARASLKSVTGLIWKACTRFLLSKSLILPWMRTYTPTPHSAACPARTTECMSQRAMFSRLAHHQTRKACLGRLSRQDPGCNTNSVPSLANQRVHAMRACKTFYYLTC